MEKKLPKVFANSLNEIHNNKTVFCSSGDRNVEEVQSEKKLSGKTINQKINEIFNSPNYIYKAEVELDMEDGTVTKKIIGKNMNNLITMDNELIPINKIKDIRYK